LDALLVLAVLLDDAQQEVGRQALPGRRPRGADVQDGVELLAGLGRLAQLVGAAPDVGAGHPGVGALAVAAGQRLERLLGLLDLLGPQGAVVAPGDVGVGEGLVEHVDGQVELGLAGGGLQAAFVGLLGGRLVGGGLEAGVGVLDDGLQLLLGVLQQAAGLGALLDALLVAALGQGQAQLGAGLAAGELGQGQFGLAGAAVVGVL